MTSVATAGDTFSVFGTTATLVVSEPAAVRVARAVADAELAAVDQACSRFRPDSELSRLNAAGDRAVAVSGLFAEILARSAARGPADRRRRRPDLRRAAGRHRLRPRFRVADGGRRHRAAPGRAAPPGARLAQRAAGPAGWPGPAPRRRPARPGGDGQGLGGGPVRRDDRRADRLRSAGQPGRRHRRGRGRPRTRAGGSGSPTITQPARTRPGRRSPSRPAAWLPPARRCAPGRWTASGCITSSTRPPASPARSCWRTVSVAAGSCVDANTASTAAIIRSAAAPTLAAGGRPAGPAGPPRRVG